MAKRPRIMKASPSTNHSYQVAYKGMPNSASNSAAPRDPFGAQMAQSIFDFYEEDGPEPAYYHEEDTESDDMWLQGELPLFNTGELEDILIARINKFESGYRKMMLHALKWHYLEEDLNANPSLKAMFDSIQVIRKLSGSKGV